MVGISASAQAYLNVELQDSDDYFTKGGINIGVSIQDDTYIHDNLITEVGFGFFKNDAATFNEADIVPNVLGGLGWKVYDKDSDLNFVAKVNYRGYLLYDDIKGYFEPGFEVQFNEQFKLVLGYAMEIHRTGYNFPTGRLGLKFKF